jgi:hypothetical protein
MYAGIMIIRIMRDAIDYNYTVGHKTEAVSKFYNLQLMLMK